MIDEKKQKIADALISFWNNSDHKKEIDYSSNEEANKLLSINPTAFLFAVIMDQGARAETIWEIPLLLMKKMGHLDVTKVSQMDDEEFIDIFNTLEKKPRYPQKQALWIKKASQIIIQRYHGHTEELWNDNPRSDDLQRRFGDFPGIGQKKASMAANLLVRDYGINIRDMDKAGIDVSYDVHIRRVFLRTGLVKKDTEQEVIEIARKLNPTYPGALDGSAWLIGRQFCYPNKPLCDKCPIASSCLKIIS